MCDLKLHYKDPNVLISKAQGPWKNKNPLSRNENCHKILFSSEQTDTHSTEGSRPKIKANSQKCKYPINRCVCWGSFSRHKCCAFSSLPRGWINFCINKYFFFSSSSTIFDFCIPNKHIHVMGSWHVLIFKPGYHSLTEKTNNRLQYSPV